MNTVMQVAFQQLAMGNVWATVGALLGVFGALLIIWRYAKAGFTEIDEKDLGIRTAIFALIAVALSQLGAATGIVGNLLTLGALGLMGIIAGYIVVLVITPVVKAVSAK